MVLRSGNGDKDEGDDHMTRREADRLKVVQAVMDRMIRIGPASKRFGVTPRQLERLLLRYKEKAPAG
jgi:hypothetical protein